MPLSANARILAAQSYIRDVRAAGEFMHRQDEHRAEDRYERLLARLNEARELLSWNPEAGRPAKLLNAQAIQVQAIAQRVQERIRSHELPTLRELIVNPYILLYAHGNGRVLLMALKHERQQSFAALDR